MNLTAEPSAVVSFSESNANLVGTGGLSSTTGLIETTTYDTSSTATKTSAGGVAGYAYETFVQQGTGGTPIKQSTQTYFTRVASSGATVHPIASMTSYRNTNGTGGETTSYAYTWYTGTAQTQSVTTTLPTITEAQNGPNSAATTTTYFDVVGRPVWRLPRRLQQLRGAHPGPYLFDRSAACIPLDHAFAEEVDICKAGAWGCISRQGTDIRRGSAADMEVCYLRFRVTIPVWV